MDFMRKSQSKHVSGLLTKQNTNINEQFRNRSYFPFSRGLIICGMVLGCVLSILSPIFLALLALGLLVPYMRNDTVVYNVPGERRSIIDFRDKAISVDLDAIEVMEAHTYSKAQHDFLGLAIVLIVLPILGLILSAAFGSGLNISIILMLAGLLVTGIVCFIVNIPTRSHLYITLRTNSIFASGGSINITGLIFIGIGLILLMQNPDINSFISESLNFDVPIFNLFDLDQQANPFPIFLIPISIIIMLFGVRKIKSGASAKLTSSTISITNIPDDQEGSMRAYFTMISGSPGMLTNKVEDYLHKRMRLISILLGILVAAVGTWSIGSIGIFGGPLISLLIFGCLIFVIIQLAFILFPVGADWSAQVRGNSLHMKMTTLMVMPGRDIESQTSERQYFFNNMSSMEIRRFIDVRNLSYCIIAFSIAIILPAYFGNDFLTISLFLALCVGVPYAYGSIPQYSVGFRGRSKKKTYCLPIKNVFRIYEPEFINSVNNAYVHSLHTSNPYSSVITEPSVPMKWITEPDNDLRPGYQPIQSPGWHSKTSAQTSPNGLHDEDIPTWLGHRQDAPTDQYNAPQKKQGPDAGWVDRSQAGQQQVRATQAQGQNQDAYKGWVTPSQANRQQPIAVQADQRPHRFCPFCGRPLSSGEISCAACVAQNNQTSSQYQMNIQPRPVVAAPGPTNQQNHCPRCGASLMWVQDYSRWFCPICNQWPEQETIKPIIQPPPPIKANEQKRYIAPPVQKRKPITQTIEEDRSQTKPSQPRNMQSVQKPQPPKPQQPPQPKSTYKPIETDDSISKLFSRKKK
jgi:uncharacterized Zn finger protein (UPF0148 family)